MKSFLPTLALCCAFLSPAFAQPWEAPTGPNLVQNPGFEEMADGRPVAWYAPEAAYAVDDTVAGSGARSLRFTNPDPDSYLLCLQSLPLQPGLSYEIRAQVRTRGLTGADSGATLCLEWADAQGKYLGGCYPDGKKGDTSEWTEIVGVSPPLPPNAARVTITCYVRKGMAGTAWWDDVSVRRYRVRPMTTQLLSPNYRGLLWEDRAKAAVVRVRLVDSELEVGRGAVRLSAQLSSAAGKVVARGAASPGPGDFLDLRLALPKLSPGVYSLRVALLNPRGEILYEESHRVERAASPPPKVYVDEYNRLIVDGKPFFPLGMYWSGVNEEELRIYRASPFNCLMPYGSPTREQMDLIARQGLKMIYTIKDYYAGTEWCPDFIKSEADEEPAVRKTVREFRDHPALLAWYTNDERPLSMLPRLEAHQRWVEEEDPNHPTWVVLYQVDEVDRYVNTFDVIGTDPYPIPTKPPSMAGDWARQTRQGVAGARAMWMVPQVFRWPDQPRPPSLDELRSMTWQCLTEGANGLVFYSWFEIRGDKQFPFSKRWFEVKQVAEEVRAMIPVLLSVEPTPPVKVTAPASVHWTTRRSQGALYLVLVNDSTAETRASVRLPHFPKQVTTVQGGEKLTPSKDLTVTLPPLGVRIYRVAL
jgi:hypothetical protein